MFATLTLNPYPNLLKTSIPLLESEKVDAIEWNFDTLSLDEIPDWFIDLLEAFNQENRLIGHGVFYNMFKGNFSQNHKIWLKEFGRITKRFDFDHITEHFGFFTGKDFHSGAPLPVPMNASTIQLGIDRLKRVQELCHCAVGLENLAFAGSIEEVKYHGEFLNNLLEPIDGIILLDFHNIFCQMINFDLSFEEIIESYPVNRVREIHVSGGSWDLVSSTKNIRRDTHDSQVPSEVFDLLEKYIHLFPNLKYITLEQMDHALTSEEEQSKFQTDFNKMKSFTKNRKIKDIPFIKSNFKIQNVENNELELAQNYFSDILENTIDLISLESKITENKEALIPLNIENWNQDMLETAMKIAQKWK